MERDRRVQFRTESSSRRSLDSGLLPDPVPVLGDPGVDARFVPEGAAFAPADHAHLEDTPPGVGDGQRPAGVALRVRAESRVRFCWSLRPQENLNPESLRLHWDILAARRSKCSARSGAEGSDFWLLLK